MTKVEGNVKEVGARLVRKVRIKMRTTPQGALSRGEGHPSAVRSARPIEPHCGAPLDHFPFHSVSPQGLRRCSSRTIPPPAPMSGTSATFNSPYAWLSTRPI